VTDLAKRGIVVPGGVRHEIRSIIAKGARKWSVPMSPFRISPSLYVLLSLVIFVGSSTPPQLKLIAGVAPRSKSANRKEESARVGRARARRGHRTRL